MIGKLSGIVDTFLSNGLILDVGGVGYLLQTSQRTRGKLGQVGEAASLLVETNVREDAITLYGFADAVEQEWFRLLTSVQGVGAKAAMAILSAVAPEKVGLAIAAQDKAMLTQADGVGPKLAARILTELKDKAANMELSPKSVDGSVDKSVSSASEPGSGVDTDAISALLNLGYSRADAYSAVMRAKADGANDNLQDLIRVALKELSG